MSYGTELVFQNPRNRVPESSSRIWSQLTPQRSSRIMLHISLAAMNTHTHTHTLSLSLSLSLSRSLLPSGFPSVSVPFTEHVLCTKGRTTKLPKGFPSQQTPKTTPEKNRPKAARTFLRQPRRQKNQRYCNPRPLIPEAAAEETTIKATTQDSDHLVE
jgi:hypothetical protein